MIEAFEIIGLLMMMLLSGIFGFTCGLAFKKEEVSDD